MRLSALSRDLILVLLVSAACLLPALGRITLTEHEVFAAEPAREMLDGGSLLLQQFAGQYRLKKPPGQSWLIAASIAVFGPTDFAARLPSAVAGAGVAVATLLIGTWTLGRRVGWIAGLMMLTCVGLQQRAHLAEADMALACAVAVANAAVVLTLSRERSAGQMEWRAGALFWAAIVAGFLLKGPIVLGFTVLPALVTWGVLRRRDRAAGASLARGPLWWPWILIGMLVIVAWVAAALHSLPFPIGQAIDNWKHEIGDRVAGGLRRDSILAYLWLIPEATLPWFPFAFAAIGPFVRLNTWRRPTGLFLTCWGGCGLLMISLIAFKRMHYALPMLLPVVLMAAIGFDRLLRAWLRRRPRPARPTWRRLATGTWFGLAVVGWLLNWTIFAPRLDPGGAVKAFAKSVNRHVPPGETVWLVDVGEDRTAWYLRRPVRGVKSLGPAGGYAICMQKDLDTFARERHGEQLELADPYTLPSKHTDEDERQAERRVLMKVPPEEKKP